MSALARLRRFWLDVHLWLGVGLLIPFAILGVTGSLLVWHDPLERVFEPQRYAVTDGPSAPLATHLEAARAALSPDFIATTVRPPAEAGDPVIVQGRAKARPPESQRPQTRTVWLDPATARVLDVANPRANAFGVMHVLHGSLMIPDVGRKVVGWLGWAMLISSLTGIWLWWPRNGKVLRGLRWRRGPRTTFNLHHLAGFWLSIPLAALALTGAYISFPQTARGFVGLFVELPAQEQRNPRGPGGPGGGPAPIERPNLSIDAAASAARTAVADAKLISIALPTRAREGASWRIQMQREGATTPTAITVDDASGTAAARGERTPSPSDGVARLMRRLHDGNQMSPIWQWIIFLAGWAPAVLGVTGIVMWLRRRAARRAIRRGHPDHSPSAPQAPQAAE